MTGGAPHGPWPIQWECRRCGTILPSSGSSESAKQIAARLLEDIPDASTLSGVDDFTLEDHGSIVLVRPLSDHFAQWLHKSAPEDAQFFGNALAVEPRYVEGFLEAAADAGWQLRGP